MLHREVNVWESQHGGSFAFALAVLTNNVELIKHTAKSAVRAAQLPEDYGVPHVWKKRLVTPLSFSNSSLCLILPVSSGSLASRTKRSRYGVSSGLC